MEHTIEFGGDPQDVTITTSGEATAEGFARMNAEFVADARFRPGMLVLLDHTHLLVDTLTSDAVGQIAHGVVALDEQIGPTVAAIVAPEPVQFGLSRMSTLLAGDMRLDVRVFFTREDAREWLRAVRR